MLDGYLLSNDCLFLLTKNYEDVVTFFAMTGMAEGGFGDEVGNFYYYKIEKAIIFWV